MTFLLKSSHLLDNAENRGRARQATDDNIIERVRFACRISRATNMSHSQNM